ncbi:MAG: acyl carrier protein [Gemmatimonadota bacterium]
MKQTETELREAVVRIVSEVLVVPPEEVRHDSALVADLGAESIDFLDLIFRLEEWLGVRVPVERMDLYLKTRQPALDPTTDITPNLVLAFAAEVLASA